jgi:hypothetical protein
MVKLASAVTPLEHLTPSSKGCHDWSTPFIRQVQVSPIRIYSNIEDIEDIDWFTHVFSAD